VNLRGTLVCSQACLPWLKEADNPHILVMAPPPNIQSRWFRDHSTYTLSKYGMSLAAYGLAAELESEGIAVNTLWPRTVIATAALARLGGRVKPEQCRKPGIVADAAHAILTRPSRDCTSRHFIDDEALAEAGITNLDDYA